MPRQRAYFWTLSPKIAREPVSRGHYCTFILQFPLCNKIKEIDVFGSLFSLRKLKYTNNNKFLQFGIKKKKIT